MNKNKGFVSFRTMIFSIVIVLLLIVCIALFLGYTSTSYQVKADDVAQKAFYATREYLERIKSPSKLEEFNKKAKYFGKALSMDLQEEILRENLEDEQEDEQEDAAWENYQKQYEEGDVRYIMLESAQIASEDRSENPLLAIFEKQILDTNLWEHTFLVEYNAKTGDVIAVIYSKEAEKLKYEGAITDKENVIARDKKLLKQKQQGYFGVSLNELLD